MLRARAIFAVAICWLALGALPMSAPAQAPATEAAPAEEAPTAIPVAEVALRAEALEGRLRQIDDGLAAGEISEGLAAELEKIESQIESAQLRLERMLAQPRTAASLEALFAVWRRISAQLAAQTQQLSDRARQLDAWRDEIRGEIEVWRLTRDEARSASAPQAVVNRVVELVLELQASDARLKASRDTALGLQGRIADRQRATGPALARIEAGRAELAASLLQRQHEPVWSTRFVGEEVRAELAVLGRSLDDMVVDLVSYLRLQRGRLVIHLLMILVLGWGFARARTLRGRRAEAEQAGVDGGEGDALRYPWASAVLFGLLLSFLLYPGRGRGFRLAVALLALPVWLRVFRSLLPPALRLPVIGVAVLALAEAARFAFAGFDLVARSLLVLDLAAGLAGVLWLSRTGRVRQIPPALGRGLWFRVLDGWLRLIGVAFGVGLVAAILGYSNLAGRIGILAVWGTVFGLGWLAVVRTAEAVAESAINAGLLDFVHMVRGERPRLLGALRRGFRGLGFFTWVYMLLEAAQLWDLLRDGLGALLGARLGYGPIDFSLGGVVAFGITLYGSWLIARFVSFALEQEVFARVQMPSGVPFALTTFTRYGIIVAGFVAALTILGFSWDRISLLVGALGVGIGFGLQNVVNNFVSGIILLFERPVRVGDRVQIDDLFGIITTIGIRASKLRTFDGSDVIVPNGEFISARVTNWTLSDRKRRIILPVRVAYGTKPRRVLEILLQVARGHTEVLEDPAPESLFRSFGTSSLDFELRAWTEGDFLAVMSDLAVATEEAFAAAGIQIPFPQRDLHVRNVAELQDALAEAVRVGRSPESDEAPS